MVAITNELGNTIGVPANPLVVSQSAGALQAGATVLQGSSGDVAAAAATVTFAAVAAKTNYLAGFDITGGGATAASVIQATVVGLLGGTRTINIPVPAGATLGIVPIVEIFNPPLPASAANIAIVVSAPSFGAGNLHASVNAQGYQA